MRENRTYGSEGGEANAFPTPISRGLAEQLRRPLATACGAALHLAKGRLAQLVEHLVYTERVGGSSPSPPTNKIKYLPLFSPKRPAPKNKGPTPGPTEEKWSKAAMITGETIAIAAATLIGPIAAVLITRWNDRRSQERARLLTIYRTLMATRRMAVSQEHVGAINMIEVEFHGVRPVVDAWSAYITHLNNTATSRTPEQAKAWDDRRSELLAMLLVKIASHLGITKGEIEILHGGYAPQGWVDQEARSTRIQNFVIGLSQGKVVVPISVLPPSSANPFPPPP
jgi:hypothetical protein